MIPGVLDRLDIPSWYSPLFDAPDIRIWPPSVGLEPPYCDCCCFRRRQKKNTIAAITSKATSSVKPTARPIALPVLLWDGVFDTDPVCSGEVDGVMVTV
jgi:hypothetical protein